VQHLVSQYYGGSHSADDMALSAIWNNHAFAGQDAPTQLNYPDLFDGNGYLLSLDQITSNQNSSAYSEFNQWLNQSTGQDAVGNILDSVDSGYNIGWTEPTSWDQEPTE
jgi:hypothetical protein